MNLMRASNQWFTRPDDERFISLEDLHAATLARANRCESHVMRHDHLEVVVPPENDDRRLALDVPGIDALVDPTHWSFGQLCSRAMIDKRTARRTHPTIAADLINYGMRFDEHEQKRAVDKSNVMLHVLPSGEVEMRCMVGPNYGRVYDHQVVNAVQRVNETGYWHVPAGSTFKSFEDLNESRKKRATTLYASDRDVFIFLVDESRPLEINGDTLFRGFMVWNSEVGNMSLGISTFLYRHICDNRIVWGAQDVRTMRMVHSSNAPERFEREVRPTLNRYAEASLSKTVASIKKAKEMEVGSSDDAVEEWLSRRRQFTKAESKKIVRQANIEEGECRTVWDIVQGGTALARGIKHTDTRVQYERKVSNLLGIAESKVA
jgi:hypothetical protein